jgi:hypothetical protein
MRGLSRAVRPALGYRVGVGKSSITGQPRLWQRLMKSLKKLI